MATLSSDPDRLELEDFIAAHFASRGCYVETGVKERCPDEILELDIFWTDYRQEPQRRQPVEVKSGDWGMGDLFKFYGWTQYLGLDPGQFIHKQSCGRVASATLKAVEDRTKISLLHVPEAERIEQHLKTSGLPEPASEELPSLWRFSFQSQRRLLAVLQLAIKNGVCCETAKVAKEYHRLINDAVFFDPHPVSRIHSLLNCHFAHPKLAASAALEYEKRVVNLDDPPSTTTFKNVLYRGGFFPAQTCLYLAHRARLYIVKALVDAWLAGCFADHGARVAGGPMTVDITAFVTPAMKNSLEELSKSRSFRQFPVFWQVFLWSWGGFLLTDRLDEEYARLERETGVPKNEIDVALGAYDKLFPLPGGGSWFQQPSNDSRRLLKLMPAAMRGIGAYRRKLPNDEAYKDLGFKDQTSERLVSDHNNLATLLDGSDTDLIT